ncbi:hypothetical protein GCM10025859_63360 [Alicyclobacillus fastidiosus]|nr:hypothetical protein GCM10025859_62630 [Alicyclobacillus fastidiosus]GMA65895.1 hypothetical protein GCM10025859_63360 [Alicyclobacillus fastidiosus]
MNAFKWKHFESHIILMAVRWYLQYSLSYRDIVELLKERGVQVSHTTIMRWVTSMVLRSINAFVVS